MNQLPNYLYFVATFADGSQIFQDETDVSRLDPQKSQFYDVLEKEKESPLISFILRNADYVFGVDLRDGHFEVGGVPFFQHRADRETLTGFRIIYLRNVIRRLNTETLEESAELGYTLGWQTTFEGKNIQRIIKI